MAELFRHTAEDGYRLVVDFRQVADGGYALQAHFARTVTEEPSTDE